MQSEDGLKIRKSTWGCESDQNNTSSFYRFEYVSISKSTTPADPNTGKRARISCVVNRNSRSAERVLAVEMKGKRRYMSRTHEDSTEFDGISVRATTDLK
jgi:hypothetical protein